MLEIKENINNVDEFVELYNSVGWGAYSKDISSIAMKNTFYSISIYSENEIVGYGRIIGDGICFLYICDIMVKNEFQGKKIGTMIMNKLLDKIKEIQNQNTNLRTYLGASKGKEEFYNKTRKELNLGEGMVLK